MWNRALKFTIRAKIISLCLLTVTMVSLFLGTYYPIHAKHQIYDAMQKREHSVAEMVAIGVGIGMEMGDYSAVTEAIHLAKRYNELKLLIVLDLDGSVFASYNPDNLKLDAGKLPKDVDIIEIEGIKLHVIKTPIQYHGEIIGSLVYVNSLDAIDIAISNAVLTGLGISVAVLLLGIVVSYIFSGTITRSLTKLRLAALDISDGNLDVEVEVTSNDEIAVLSNAFNQMVRNVRESVKQLEESREESRLIVETAADAFVRIDDKGFITAWNAKAEEIFGWSCDEAIGEPMWELIIPQELQTEHNSGVGLSNRAEAASSFCMPVEMTARHRDNHKFSIEITTWSVRSGQKTFLNSFIRDITKRKLIEEGLARTEKLESVGVLAGGIAHDFNNLLTGILGNIELAKLESDPREGATFLDMAINAVLRATGLTKQFLTFSKGGNPVIEVADVEEVIRESATFALSGSCCKVKFTFAETLLPAKIDKGQIGQVIHNLVINASQAMEEKGTIHISVQNVSNQRYDSNSSNDKSFILIEVQDKGVGIPQENLKNIFDPYFTTNQEVGHGLGLAAVHSIVKLHGGRLEVESKEGVGSTFGVILPACVSDKPTEISDNRMDDGVRKNNVMTSGKRILVMDDESFIRDIATKILHREGYSVSCVENGSEVLLLYTEAQETKKPYDIVILDLTIPGGMGGKDTIQMLQEIDPNVKAIVCSGYADDPVMASFEEFGFLGVVSKPFKSATLLDSVSEILFSDKIPA